ncbi:pyrroline-5-carboxylate reductase [Bacillus sp. CGMCC 1.16607]|uniref:pyrroline-5-carboxylate reductase n=1 Tax=Bacillus sp. CGMCC 1.16607 TaxID=3351842 RepID=UPI003629151A
MNQEEMEVKKIAIIGAGSIAEALISGMVDHHFIDRRNIWITNRSDSLKLEKLQGEFQINTTYDLFDLMTGADIVILTMKPKDAGSAIEMIKPFLTEKMLMVSVLAGVSLQTIEELAERPLAIIRAMPNTSAAIGKSATALAYNTHSTLEQVECVKKMFDTIGLTRFVEEAQLDAVTGLSGSGPAYFYYLVEAMEKSAVEIGLEPKLAKELIVQTLLGTAEMLTKSQKPSYQLRREVTSPGGTTEAGIRVLEQYNVQEAFITCIIEATNQSKKLGTEFKSTLPH